MGDSLLIAITAACTLFTLAICLVQSFIKTRILRRIKQIMATQAELAEQMRQSDAKLDLVAESLVAQGEVINKINADIQRLKDAIDNSDEVSDELQEAANALSADSDDLTEKARVLAEGLAATDEAGGNPPEEPPIG